MHVLTMADREVVAEEDGDGVEEEEEEDDKEGEGDIVVLLLAIGRTTPPLLVSSLEMSRPLLDGLWWLKCWLMTLRSRLMKLVGNPHRMNSWSAQLAKSAHPKCSNCFQFLGKRSLPSCSFSR